MTPALEPLPKLFDSFDAFMGGTFATMREADDYVRTHAGTKYEAVRKTNPATGEGVTRYHVRKLSQPSMQAENDKPAQPKKVKVPGETRNGITSPSSTSVGFQIWALCDDLWSIRKEPFTKSALLTAAINRGFNQGNVLTECSRWRKFHGMDWKLG